MSTLHTVNAEGTAFTFTSGLIKVLCLGMLVKVKSLQTGAPQKLNGETTSFTACGTGAAHNNCAVEFKELPTFTVLKTELNLGTLKITKGPLYVKCSGIIPIECTYDTKGLEFEFEGALRKTGTGHGMITSTNTPLEESSGSFCPEKVPTVDFLLEPTEHVHIAGIENLSTALCKVHQEPCESANLIKTLHINTSDPTLLIPYSGSTKVMACQSSLVSAAVGELGAPQVITIEEFSWTGCTIGGNSCTVKTVELGTLYLYRTGLNVGNAAASDDEIEVACTNPSFTCKFAGEPSLTVEGAEHTGGAGHGMFRATEAELELTEGPCDGAATLHGLFEPLIDLSVVS